MSRQILLGDEAVALGAVDAGMSGAYAYPGTPSTEIFEAVEQLAKRQGLAIHTRWSANEKVAMEEAAGMSYAGKRALVSFKHVGLNVAADPFMNVAITGAYGGLVVAVADDPSMHSSQNEQDSRHFADFAQIPCLEPADQQQAYEMIREAFDVSEAQRVPVMLRLVTRLAHSRAVVTDRARRPQNEASYTPDPTGWTLLPGNARVAYDRLLGKQRGFLAWSDEHPANVLNITRKGRPAVLASGIAWGYVEEALGAGLESWNTLRVGAYPVPKGLVQRLFTESSEVWVVEEGYPFIERLVTSIAFESPIPVRGRLTGHLPRAGELDPDVIRRAFHFEERTAVVVPGLSGVLRQRPPLLCDGCPHIDSFALMWEALGRYPGARVMGDIGCYTLGAYEPLHAIHSCLCMGASISMASGVAHAGVRPVACVIGDSTFTHSGITPLLDAAHEDTPMTVFILDNAIVAMTGGQPTMTFSDEIERLLLGVGVKREHLHVLSPVAKAHDENLAIIAREIAHEGLSVIVTSRACVTYAKQIKEDRREHQAQRQPEATP